MEINSRFTRFIDYTSFIQEIIKDIFIGLFVDMIKPSVKKFLYLSFKLFRYDPSRKCCICGSHFIHRTEGTKKLDMSTKIKTREELIGSMNDTSGWKPVASYCFKHIPYWTTH